MSTQEFHNEPTKLDEIHLKETLAHNKALHFTSRYMYLTLWGDEISNQTQFKEVIDRIAGPTNNLQYAHISPVEKDEINPHPHQHLLIVTKRPRSFKARPIIKHSDGTQQTFWYSRVNSYTSRTGDISNIIKYITKKGPGMYKGDPTLKEDLKQTWINALNELDSYQDFNELEKNLLDINAEKYIQQEGKIKARWMRKNARRLDIENYTRTDLLPWREDMEEIQTIRKWLKCAQGNKYRMGNLFIVGPTKTGKTEFAIQEIFLKYNTFMLRGDSLFDAYDDEQNYRFILFDDINYDKNLLRLIKAITSTINKKTMVNVKYSKAIVTARPCVHLLNQKEYEGVVDLMKYNGGYNWWKRNSLKVFIDKKLYKDPEESEKDSEDMEKQEENYNAMEDLQEKYDSIKDIPDEQESEETNPIEHVSFYKRVTNLMESLGYDEEFLEGLTEKLTEAKKDKKMKKILNESQEDNTSMIEEWNEDLEEYQTDNPLGMTKEDFNNFEKETMSQYEKQRSSYFNNRLRDDYMDEEDDDYEEDDDFNDENALPEHRPFGGKDGDMDIIYD
ncbi:hypothetical protein EDI_113650 [Entamoeba dispar SAW760]|uniref:Uncharacterized protein n=1 Tax=Entamoeba dispar (strain ATCC PRA-260 / SAW760) TaxID=370354 RepID=B0ECM0_ENTDS|nr:uncharacterized protein EDI_113650 [Entamoeba dispar SAW760]EDR27726.1 hypothetical protein EDI_113650 [Entamoeba dispar SAW760]|eukprot:EDR27726.1 hypothetical protein EDI_113650 [Entamoeba dispar SAW760]